MPRFVLLPLFLLPALLLANADERRLQATGEIVTSALRNAAVPRATLEAAECVVTVPGVSITGRLAGTRYGHGFVTCRDDHAGWTSPAAIRLVGGPFGMRLRGTEPDVVLLIMTKLARQRMLGGRFQLDGPPLTSGWMGMADQEPAEADVVAWTRSRGEWLGGSLSGVALRQDVGANRMIYGRVIDNREILTAPPVAPKAAEPLLAALKP